MRPIEPNWHIPKIETASYMRYIVPISGLFLELYITVPFVPSSFLILLLLWKTAQQSTIPPANPTNWKLPFICPVNMLVPIIAVRKSAVDARNAIVSAFAVPVFLCKGVNASCAMGCL